MEPQQTQESKTKVHFSRQGAYKYVTGNRQPISIRIDEGLYKAFKPVAKRVYGSVCRAVEVYITTLIEATENGVHFSNTEKPINISKIVIARNLRPRRKLEVEYDGPICGFSDCEEIAVGNGVYRENRPYRLCERHLAEAKGNPREWKVI